MTGSVLALRDTGVRRRLTQNLMRGIEMMQKVKLFAPGAVVRYTAAVTALAILPFGVARAQDGAKNAKKIVKPYKGDSPKFDVLVSRSDNKKKSGHAKPVAITIAFADGSTQKIDISKYGFVTIDVGGQRVKMQPAGQPPKFVAGKESAHFPPDVSTKAPVRVPLPKNFVPGKGKGKFESRERAARKEVKTRDKGARDDGRLDRLEAMLHDLQKQVKFLHAEIKRKD